MFGKLKQWVVDQVLWAETNMKDKTGAEKRKAITDKIDAMVTLPWWLEWMDGPLIGWMVDKCCSIFNEKAGHDWKDIAPTKEAREALAQELPDVEAYTRAADEVASTVKETAQKTVETVKDTAQEAMATLADVAKITTTSAKTSSDKLSAHFSKKEFACKCCGKFIPCPELVEKLEKFRTLCGNKPITISSGTRCEKHNKAVGGASKSQHIYGTAADVQKISGLTVDQMAKKAEEAGFTGIGKYNWGVHVDVRKTPARWDYRK